MLAVILLIGSAFAFSQENCNRDELVRQCYSQLCSSRQNVPSSPEALLAEVDSNPSQLPAETINAIRNYSNSLLNARSALSAPVSPEVYDTFADSIINDTERGGERITTLMNKLVRYDTAGNPIFNNMLDEAGAASARAGYDILSTDVNMSIAAENLTGTDLTVVSDTDRTVLNDLINLYATSAPARATDLRDYQRLLAANTPIPAELTARIDFRGGIQELRRNLFTSKRAAIGGLLRANEKLALAQADSSRFTEIVNSCKLTHYVVEKSRPLNTPENIRRMATSVMAKLNTNLYPLLSEHSAGILRNILKPELVTPVRTTQQMNQFSVPTLNPNASREDQVRYLNDLGNKRCETDFISGDNAGLNGSNALQIQVGPLTLAQNAEAALAHELGHAITAILEKTTLSTESLAKITRLRRCLNGNHAGDQRPASSDGLHIAGDTFRTDEDFGDWMQATLGYDGDYLACDLGRILDYGDTNKHNPYFSNSLDPHSADLFRNLHIRLNRNQPISSQCQELMNQSPEERPQKCSL